MNMQEEKIEDILVLKPEGEIMGGEETEVFQDKLMHAIKEGCPNVVIDMTDVKWMNSSGLGKLMAGLTSLRASGGDLKLARVQERVRRPIEITKLDQVIQMHATLDDAIQSFGEGN